MTSNHCSPFAQALHERYVIAALSEHVHSESFVEADLLYCVYSPTTKRKKPGGPGAQYCCVRGYIRTIEKEEDETLENLAVVESGTHVGRSGFWPKVVARLRTLSVSKRRMY